MTASTVLRVLGAVELFREGESVPIGGPKAKLLLSILVVQRNARLSSGRLIESIWGGQPPVSATATVQSQISRLRRVLDPDFQITLASGGYRLECLTGEIDADEFESLTSHSKARDGQPRVAMLEAALALWHGDAYDEFADRDEMRSEAARLNEIRMSATEDWAETKLAMGSPAAMVGELEALVGLHPLRESYWRLLMLALYRSDRQAEALRCAADLRSMLRNDVGLDPSAASRELEAQILAGDEDILASPGSPNPRSRHSPDGHIDATSFVGRDPDLTSLTNALPQNAVITITGPGGVGKTRLAMRLSSQVAHEFADGVTVVEFASLRDAAGTALVIARALDIQQRQHHTIEVTIEEFLAPAQSLLVLDNCEHVTEILAPLVDRLRSSCPRLRILATSRQPLGLAGEYVQALAPLAVPASGTGRAVDVGRSAAVELFVNRASAAAPGFQLTDDNARSVANVCRRLEGLPLAMELAAARLRTMGIDALSERLDQRIEMQGQTQRSADGRQRTIHELVKWSYDLLTTVEQQVFEQLSVFAGGFDLAAAEAVCTNDTSPASVVGQISGLVDKSMIVLVDPGTSRYRILEPLREFGHDRLRSSGALAAAEVRHLRWFGELAERAGAGLDTAEEAVWSAALERDFSNFRAAHRTAIVQTDTSAALALVSSLREFAFRRINYEITSWADATVEMDGASGNPHFPTAVAIQAYGRFVRGDMQAAIALAHQALDASGDTAFSQSGLPERVLGNAHFYLEETDEALRWMDRMLDSARDAGHNGRIAQALYMQSVAKTSIGDEIRGAVLAGEANAAAAVAGSLTALAQAGYASGLALEASHPAESLELLQRSAADAAAAGNRWVEAFALTEVHSLQAKRGHQLEALVGFAEVVDIWYRGGDWANQWLSLRRVLSMFVELAAFRAAAVLHGALTAVGAAQAMPTAPTAEERLSAGIERTRVELGPSDFAFAVRQGATLRDWEIVAFVSDQIAELTAHDLHERRSS